MRQVFPEFGSPTTVGGTFNRCSYQKTRMSTANSMVADLVRLPCSGAG